MEDSSQPTCRLVSAYQLYSLMEKEPTVAVLLVTLFYKSDKSITRREVKHIKIVEGNN